MHLGKPKTNTEKEAEESTLELQNTNPPAQQQRIQTPLYTELTHTGNIRTHTESNFYPHVQLNDIAETPNYPVRL